MAPFTQMGLDEHGPNSMDGRIAEWAKQVRDVLKDSGPEPLASLARGVPDATTNEVAMAVGWLAHAGEVRFNRRAGLWTIALQRVAQSDADATNEHTRDS